MHFLDRCGEPGRIDLAGFNARIDQGFLLGFNDQIFGIAVPTFPEFRATHAKNSDFISNT